MISCPPLQRKGLDYIKLERVKAQGFLYPPGGPDVFSSAWLQSGYPQPGSRPLGALSLAPARVPTHLHLLDESAAVILEVALGLQLILQVLQRLLQKLPFCERLLLSSLVVLQLFLLEA